MKKNIKFATILLLLGLLYIPKISKATYTDPNIYIRRAVSVSGNFEVLGTLTKYNTTLPTKTPIQASWHMIPQTPCQSVADFCSPYSCLGGIVVGNGEIVAMSAGSTSVESASANSPIVNMPPDPPQIFEFNPYPSTQMNSRYFLDCRISEISQIRFSQIFEMTDEITYGAIACGKMDPWRNTLLYQYNMRSTQIINPYWEIRNVTNNTLLRFGTGPSAIFANLGNVADSVYLKIYSNMDKQNLLLDLMIAGNTAPRLLTQREYTYKNGIYSPVSNFTTTQVGAIANGQIIPKVTLKDCHTNALRLDFESNVFLGEKKGYAKMSNGEVKTLFFEQPIPNTNWLYARFENLTSFEFPMTMEITMNNKKYNYQITELENFDQITMGITVPIATSFPTCTGGEITINPKGYDKVIVPPSTEAQLLPYPIATGQSSIVVKQYYGYCMVNKTLNFAAQTALLATNIIENPANISVCDKDTIELRIKATGHNLTYQWYAGTTRLIGKTDTILKVVANISEGNKKYWVEVQGSCGVKTSNEATVTILPLTNIIANLSDISICDNSTATIKVNATGLNLTYQWYEGTTKLIGKTDATLQVIAKISENNKQYWVEVQGSCGVKASNKATVTVLPITKIIQQPSYTPVCDKDTAQVRVNAIGDNLTYTWYQRKSAEGTPTIVVGQTDATLKVVASITESYMKYWVQVSGTCGTQTSNEATVKVDVIPHTPVIDGTPWTCNDIASTYWIKNSENNVKYYLYKNGTQQTIQGNNHWEYGLKQGYTDSIDFPLSYGQYKVVAISTNNLVCKSETVWAVTPYTTSFNLNFTATNSLCPPLDSVVDLFDFIQGGKTKVTGNPNITSYNWNVKTTGGTLIATLDNSSTLKLSTGSYIFELGVETEYCDSTISKNISILEIPNPITITGQDAICNGAPATITADNNSLTYTWYKKTGVISGKNTYQLDNYVFATGIDTVYAIGKNTYGCTRTSNTMVVEAISSRTNLAFKAPKSYAACPDNRYDIRDNMLLNGSIPNVAIITETIKNGLSQYTFISNKTGLEVDTLNWKVDMPQSYSGSYQLYLKARKSFEIKNPNLYCEMIQDSMTITVNEAPDPFSISSPDAGLLCNQKEVLLQTPGKENVFINWMGNGIVIGQDASYTHIDINNGITKYTAVAFRGYGCQRRSTDTVVVERRFVPFDIAFTAPVFNYCENSGDKNLFALLQGSNKDDIRNQTNGYSYTLSTNNFPMQEESLLLNNATKNTLYNLQLTANKNWCSKTIDVNIIVYAKPDSAIFIGQPLTSTACFNDTVNLKVYSENAASYIWYRSTTPTGAITNIYPGATLSELKYPVETARSRFQVTGYNLGCGEGKRSAIATINTYGIITVSKDSEYPAYQDEDGIQLYYSIANANHAFVKIINSETNEIVLSEEYNCGNTLDCIAGEFYLNIPGVNSNFRYEGEIIFSNANGCNVRRTPKIEPYVAGRMALDAIVQASSANNSTTEETPVPTPKTKMLRNIQANNSFTMYPNPTKDKITINLSEAADFVQIVDMMGHVVTKIMLDDTLVKEIDLTNLISGNYIVFVFRNNKPIAKKLQIVR